jgi:hypothetical protein
MYKMTDYDGPPEYDMVLREMVDRHLGQASDRRPESHESMIIRCDENTAKKLDMETEVNKELMKNHVWIKDFRDELKVEALKCFNRHMRPVGMCIDYHDESKTIGRKIGIPKDKRQYLCEHCPVNSFVEFKGRQEAGLYSTKD